MFQYFLSHAMRQKILGLYVPSLWSYPKTLLYNCSTCTTPYAKLPVMSTTQGTVLYTVVPGSLRVHLPVVREYSSTCYLLLAVHTTSSPVALRFSPSQIHSRLL